MKKVRMSLTAAVIAISACSSDENNVNTPPVVEAGERQTIDERSMVVLQGNASDTQGSVSVQWEQISGETVDIEDANTLTASFRAPSTSDDETLVFRLTATDGEGVTASDDVTVVVNDRRASSQGINEDANERRERVNNDRDDDNDFIDNREVRTIDGSLNNNANPLWGAAFTQLKRWGEPDYEDGVSTMSGVNRPSARLISNNIHHQETGEVIPNNFGTSDFVWQWGQFIDHDFGLTDGLEEIADISVPTGDPFFDPQSSGSATILFSRAIFDHDTGTSTRNPREQENELTAWIDGSMIYGSDEQRASAIRVGEDSPYLATSEGNLLPFNTSGQTNGNAFGVEDDELFLGGEVRANEQVGLTVMHTLWVREHNRLAAILEEQLSGASGEEIFQAARRLVIAELQAITYNEYLPALIGDNALSRYEGYDNTVDPGLYNAFSVAAFRHGHSLINDQILRLDAQGNTIDEGNLSVREVFFTAPSILTNEQSIEPILRGLASQLHQAIDVKVTSELRNFLFGLPGQGGLDLVALNIQRGRDHGVPSYNDMRDQFGLARKQSFSEVTSDTELQVALEATYASVDDIDLFTGGLAENPVAEEGSQLGPLFRAMVTEQFEALRDGDRFWYQNYLTDEELDMIEGVTLADVIRNNTGIGNEIPDNVFYVSDSTN